MVATAHKNLLDDLVARARRAGADAADAMLAAHQSLAVQIRLGKVETSERAEASDLGLRVLIGKKQAVVSSTDVSPQALDAMVERAVAMAKLAPEDPLCGLASQDDIARTWAQLDLFDATTPTADHLIAQAAACEQAALAVVGVTNSEGAEASWGSSDVTLVASNGFAGSWQRSRHSLAMSALAGEGTGMERDYDYTSTVFAADLDSAESIGRKAGERAVRRLGARKMPTCQVPVVFDPRPAAGLLGHFLGAISGSAIALGTSFLKDMLHKPVFADGVTIVDDPFRPRGLRSRPFDAEGIAPQHRALIDNGVLTSWLLDLRSARKLGLRSTGHASRSPGGMPSPSASNVYLQAGKVTPQDLIADIKQGFYVTELMGMGVNGATGDYSRGASGFWIENGQIAWPVNEMTIAGNLKDMYRALTPAHDLELKREIESPTLRIEGMTVAGL